MSPLRRSSPAASGSASIGCCSPRAPSRGASRCPAATSTGSCTCGSIADSEAIRERIERGGKLVTIGAGWIGAEVAASARQKGCEVTVLERASVPLERVLGPELGAIYRDIHLDHGVELLSEVPWRDSRATAAWRRSGSPAGG